MSFSSGWMREDQEPVHVHVVEGVPRANATKIWLTQSGKAILASQHSEIAPVELRKLIRIIEANADIMREKWLEYFEQIRYYC